MALIGLEGVKQKTVDSEFINKGTDITKVLSAGKAATTAGDNGAINIWKDDEGFIRCEAMRYFATLEKKKYKSILSAIGWVNRWIPKIK